MPAESISAAGAVSDRICAGPGLFHRSLFLFSAQLSESVTKASGNLGLAALIRKLHLSGGSLGGLSAVRSGRSY